MYDINKPRILGKLLAHRKKDRIILAQARRNNEVIYGAQAIKKQMPGFLARKTIDYDIYSRKPRKSANQLENSLDKLAGFDNFYVKQRMHKTTFGVYDIGLDFKKGSDDDFNIADYTRQKKRLQIKRIRGNNYVDVSEVVKSKRATLTQQQFAYRHKKDFSDVRRVSVGEQVQQYKNDIIERMKRRRVI